MNSPAFFLASTEGYGLSTPRACYPVRDVKLGNNPKAILCYIDPPIIGQSFGLGAQNIEFVLLAPRHDGFSISPVSEWPGYVHVARIKSPPPHDEVEYKMDQVEEIAWGEIYPTTEEAEKSVRQSMQS